MQKSNSKEEINNITSEEYYKEVSKFLVNNKYRANENGDFFEIATLELDVLCKIHDIYLNYYC